jgi:hypothetical protein
MKIISTRKYLLLAAILTAGVISGTGTAHAYDRDWHRHEVYAHRNWHGPHYVGEPGVVYAPPVVYEPPPPVESPGFNLIVPLHIR